MSSRDRLLEHAWTLLAREGRAAPEALAREAGVSKALVFHHFRDVAGLHEAMAERVLRETQAGLDALAREHPHPHARIEALARALLAEPPDAPAAARRVMRFWLADDPRAGGGERGAASEGRGAARDALITDFVTKTLKEARFAGDARGVASLLLARWHGATVVYASGGYVDFDRELERALQELERALR